MLGRVSLMGNIDSQLRHTKLVLEILRQILFEKYIRIRKIENQGFSRKTIQKYLKAFERLGFLKLKGKTWIPNKARAFGFLYEKERPSLKYVISHLAEYWISQAKNKAEMDGRLVSLIYQILWIFAYRRDFWYDVEQKS